MCILDTITLDYMYPKHDVESVKKCEILSCLQLEEQKKVVHMCAWV